MTIALVLAAAVLAASAPSEEVALTVAIVVGRTDDKAPGGRDVGIDPAVILYAGGDGEEKAREQLVKRGEYMASNLAYNSDYGLLIEDPTQLNDLVAGAMAGSDDIVAVVIRNMKGRVLARKGVEIKDLPPAPSPRLEVVDAVTLSGDPVLLFRAAVRARSKPAAGGPRESVPEPIGGVEVAIRRSVPDLEARWMKLLATLKDSYRLSSIDLRQIQYVPFRLNDAKLMDAVRGGPKIEITLIGLGPTNVEGGSPLATYRVRIKEGTKLLAEQPAVAIAPNARAIIGTRNGPAAPYLFLVLESRAVAAAP